MTRTTTPAVDAANAAEVVPALLLLELDWPSGAVRVNNSDVNFLWPRWPAGTASETFTADAGTDILTLTAADERIGLGDAVRLTTTGTLPSPLAVDTDYYAIPNGASLQLAESPQAALEGTVIDLADAGSGTHGLTLHSQLFVGLGALSSIDQIEETSDLEMAGVGMTLSAIPAAMVARVLGEHYQGRDCNIWWAPLSPGHAVMADPVLVFPGRIDTCRIVLGSTATIQLTAENKLADWKKARVRRYTHEDQIAEYPADKGLEFVPQMVEKVLVWGRS